MSVRDQLLAIIVKNPSIQLNPGEVCFYQTKAQVGTPREEIITTTKTKPGLGFGVRVTKHFGVGIGRQKVTTTTESHTVWEKEPCDFLVLDDRMVLKLKKQNVIIDYDKVTNLKVNKDALTITVGSSDCVLFMAHKDVERFINVYKLIGEAGKEGIDTRSLISGDAPSDEATRHQSAPSNQKGVPEAFAKAVFLDRIGKKANPVKKRDEYPQYLFYECNIQNASKYHKDMIQEGYLEPAPMADILATMKVPELKEILQNNGLKGTGKKTDLIAAIIENVPEKTLSALFPEKRYVLSEMGKSFLDEHADYIRLSAHQSWNISPAEYDTAKGANGRFYDVCWGIFNSRIMNVDNLTQHRNIYYNMYTLLKEEGKNQNAMEMLLRVLYYDVNSLSSGYLQGYREGYFKKKEFLEKAAQEVYFAPAIIKDIGDMEEYFSEEMIERLYSHKDALQPCSKKLFSEIVHAILDGNFDEYYYKQCIVADYRKA